MLFSGWPFILFLTLVSQPTGLGSKDNNDLQSLLDSERAFMEMARKQNTRDAFLFYLSDKAVTAEPGKGPRCGKKYLESQKPNESWLYWHPSFSEIASSGDFGYNTGPWEFRVKRDDEHAAAFGQFLSVWIKETNGEWKVALDMGISHGQTTGQERLTTSVIKDSNSRAGQAEILRVEQTFIEALSQRSGYAYAERLATISRFLRPGREPFIKRSEISGLLEEEAKIQYSILGADIATSGDLAYVYGKATATTRDGLLKIHSYVRIWRREAGEWKITADLLSD